MSARGLLAAIAAMGLIAGCSTGGGDGPGRPISDPQAIPDAQPRDEPPSRYGNPDSYEVNGRRYRTMDSAAGHVQRGIASWYGSKFHGRRTSSGEPFDMYGMTAAHKRLPLPTYVRVENLDNGRAITVKVNDRGPFARNRIIDLSYAAAAKLGMLKSGTAPVEIRTVTPDDPTGAGAGEASTKAVTAASSAATTRADVEAVYYVQIGAFRQRDNAYRMLGRAEAAALEAPVAVATASDPGGRLYRVRVGPLTSAGRVDAVTSELAGVGLDRTHIVVETPGEP